MGRWQTETQWAGESESYERKQERRRLSDRLVAASVAWRYNEKIIGARYSGARFSTFEVPTNQHSAALSAVRDYAESFSEHFTAGRSLLIHGPRGTGKDHLAISALYEVASQGFSSHWVDGQELYAKSRDGISKNVSELEMAKELTGFDVLLISDPLPQEGKITEFQQSTLWRIIDRRYRELKPTWITANCKDGQELSERLGPQLVDRLTDDAVVISTVGLKSYRKPHQVVK